MLPTLLKPGTQPEDSTELEALKGRLIIAQDEVERLLLGSRQLQADLRSTQDQLSLARDELESNVVDMARMRAQLAHAEGSTGQPIEHQKGPSEPPVQAYTPSLEEHTELVYVASLFYAALHPRRPITAGASPLSSLLTAPRLQLLRAATGGAAAGVS